VVGVARRHFDDEGFAGFARAAVAAHRTGDYDSQVWIGGIAAFDADGVLGCDNEQGECEPLWFAPLPVRDCCETQPAIYRGRLYARASDGLHIFALS
jgi:hypothetical protein